MKDADARPKGGLGLRKRPGGDAVVAAVRTTAVRKGEGHGNNSNIT